MSWLLNHSCSGPVLALLSNPQHITSRCCSLQALQKCLVQERPRASVSMTPRVSTQAPAPRKAGTVCGDSPPAEDVEQGMPKGRSKALMENPGNTLWTSNVLESGLSSVADLMKMGNDGYTKHLNPLRNDGFTKHSIHLQNDGFTKHLNPLLNDGFTKHSIHLRNDRFTNTPESPTESRIHQHLNPLLNDGFTKHSIHLQNDGFTKHLNPLWNDGFTKHQNPLLNDGFTKHSIHLQNDGFTKHLNPLQNDGFTKHLNPLRNDGFTKHLTPLQNDGFNSINDNLLYTDTEKNEVLLQKPH
ncbi:hypothetical protein DUI87_06667 [Hirundo rustica rustica]|uniref:Uncharacterized protein n=1 Tax=Hirundo rustica rustica TaxID=333673 RepID=A0A3M0L029_HIRRU|nr:hypothetical protein DUI87_06667 [Hirundo rustica rustica]